LTIRKIEFYIRYSLFKKKSQDIVNNMTTRGHSVTEFPGNGAVVCGITVEADGFIYANSDWRKSGDVQGINPVDL
jgi:gamma-glutamyltranspeptidase/glutathione hydrolase/leukotriene-C4 hydrolase